MIVARRVDPASVSEAFTAPFLQRALRLPLEQLPHIAHLINPGVRLQAYELLDGGARIGYAIVKIRGLILADLYFGPVVADDALYSDAVQTLKAALRRRGVLLLRLLPPAGVAVPAGLPGSFNWATSIVDISVDEGALLKSFSPNHRQSICRAEAAGISVRAMTKADIGEYAAGFVAMFARRGIHKDATEVRRLLIAALQLPDSAFILTAQTASGGPVVGGGMFFVSGDTCTYYQGYTARTSPALPVQHLLLWKAMKRARSLGCRRFDLFGYSLNDDDTQLRAINDFKRWFRGALVVHPPTVIMPLYPLPAFLRRLIRQRF